MKNGQKIFTGMILCGIIILLLCLTGTLPAQVTVTEDSLTLPTYIADPPNPMPRFYEGRSHQGVQRHIYPYPYNDNLTRNKQDKKYNMITLENDYIKIGIMPGMGGRIFEGIDKTNGYNFFYRQHVIKPTLIGMLGYWISGSLAWGYPHHHGATTVEPVDYVIEKNNDGSVTVWLSVTEYLHRLRALIGYTIFPNSSLIKMTIRPSNPTPFVDSFLFWANPSVHADTNYQVIFPPSVEYITGHHKTEMNTWPIADRRYMNYDFQGLDLSLWKNTGVPSSFFSWDPQEDFFGGYDHAKQAGTAWIGNHYTCPGMKYWADGNNPAGEMINNGLTDNDGRYIELMAGAFTDNQPDYSWLQPDESKDVTMTWYPIRLLGGLKAANTDAALNMKIKANGETTININTTRLFKNAQVVLTLDGKEKMRQKVDTSPAQPYSHTIKLDKNINEKDVKIALYDSEGNIILSYQPQDPLGKPMPEPLKTPPQPKDVKTNEELYLIGLRICQFHNAFSDPYAYFNEALQRDPGDYRVNTQMGILYSKRKLWQDAEKYLQTAVDRITMMYTRPKDSDALYYLGLVQRRLGKTKAAYDNLYDATWNAGWHTPAYHQLAEMDCEKGDYVTALDHTNRALSTNINNQMLLSLKTVLLRKLGMTEEVTSLAAKILDDDPLSYQALNELYLIAKQKKDDKKANSYLQELQRMMQGKVQSYLEFATFYANCGFYQEAVDILLRADNMGINYPMLHYSLGYYYTKLGNTDKARQYFIKAQKDPSLYCFPSRDEEVSALEEAIKCFPDDAMAYYYLGNLYFEPQPEKAITLWEKSHSLNNSFYIVQRNLGWAALHNQHDLPKALEYYEKAFANCQDDSRLMYEFDLVCQSSGVTPQERYDKIFRNNRHNSQQRSETYIQELALLNNLGRYDEVIDILATANLVESEGATQLRDIYLNAYTLKSLAEFKAGQTHNAIKLLIKALDYPLGRAQQRKAQMYYLLGLYHTKGGDDKAATIDFTKATEVNAERSEYFYYKGLAYLKLAQKDKAEEQFNALSELANRSGEGDFFRSFEAGSRGNIYQANRLYQKGLALLAVQKVKEAKEEFAQALKLDPSNIWAQYYLNE
ncbi:MAG TPA: DUF5107 domain-containing protein [bacterium]|nr:DUF5107 domain-containing protein [bacterium]HPN45993.1 DUF5107 domain-containing protein [bacterium]